MQALYGHFTAVESIKEVKRNELEEMHALDPAKHDFADKALFEARKKQAVQLFNRNILAGKVEDPGDAEQEVVDNVNEALTDYENQIHKEARVRKNDMMKEAERLQDTYIKLLLLPMEIEQREKLDSEKEDKAYIAKEKKRYPFIGNELVKQLKESELLQKEAARSSISWDNDQQEIKSWYRDQIRTVDALKHFFGGPKPDDAPDNDIVLELFKRVVFKNEAIASYLETNHLHWVENQPIVKSMVVKTIKSLQDGEGFELAELTKNGEDDFKFLERLFMDVINQNEFLEEAIQSKTMNWDVDRIALTDRVILKLALVEMMNSPSIPIKVTINEAIEISKMYSTPKSKQFVNGVLDVLSNELTSSGKIRKSGRGLIDNK
ncbi:NusB antitermination factor [Ekhidna lutea]|uniref:NusB antitermination factor n=2 Tax=Ekhidna lutea TaxID=447679 RepID=A0A239IHJ4_EKHLU|nr:NusB antitermination factor [Ekhidna lutea]